MNIKIALFIAFAVGCHTNHPTAGEGCPDVCANLLRLGCPEGSLPTCVEACQRAADERLTKIDVPCLVDAGTPAAVQVCGFVHCDGAQ